MSRHCVKAYFTSLLQITMLQFSCDLMTKSNFARLLQITMLQFICDLMTKSNMIVANVDHLCLHAHGTIEVPLDLSTLDLYISPLKFHPISLFITHN